MNVENSTQEDIETIFDLYKKATQHQRDVKGTVVWPVFERSLVEKEILEGRQVKIVENTDVACVWAITFSDKEIWEEQDNDESIYIHRIATNPKFRGNGYVEKIVDWAKQFAKAHHKKFIRMDTVGENKKLIAHYTANGFDFLGMKKLKDTAALPEHYSKDDVCLFEIKL